MAIRDEHLPTRFGIDLMGIWLKGIIDRNSVNCIVFAKLRIDGPKWELATVNSLILMFYIVGWMKVRRKIDVSATKYSLL